LIVPALVSCWQGMQSPSLSHEQTIAAMAAMSKNVFFIVLMIKVGIG
jgi:hypothetical protein